MKWESANTRIKIISILILLVTLVLISRLYFLQIVSGADFQSKADHQYVQSTYDYYDRGSIYFQTKEGDLFPAASLKTGFILAIDPKLVDNAETTFATLAALTPVDKTSFLAKAAKKEDPYEEIALKVAPDAATKIQAAGLPGVSLYQERWRYYPGGTLAAHTVGFIGYLGNDLAGRYGLERYYEDVLARNNDSAYVNFFAEIFSNLKLGLSSNGSLEGDVVTTIEPSVESELEQELALVNKTWSSQFSGGIIMDPMTGSIYAMAIDPTFDPNNLQDQSNSDIFTNKLVENVYEMGSIVKPLTMAAGIDIGAVTATTTYFDPGMETLDGRTFGNFDGKSRGVIPMQEVLNQSLNTGAAFVVQKMGKQNFARYMKNYGLGEETGIDLPNETHGLISNLDSPRDIEYATAGFGQGIAFTPIETIRALASLGNGGKLVTPHIASKIQYKIGGFKTISSDNDKQVLKPGTSKAITDMLVTVYDKALVNGAVRMPHYTIAAKTGTAQIADPSGGYYSNQYLHSFFGYFPAYNPRFIIFLYTYEPQKVNYASQTLTYPFVDLAKFLINYYQIPPDR